MRQPACGRRQDRGGIRRGHGAGGARAGHRGGDQAAGGDATGDALSRTSRHLDLLADHVRAGAHVVLRGHLGDAVLLEGKLKDETWAVGKVLVERAGIDTVLTANQADGLRRVAGESSERVGELLAELRGGDETVGLGPASAVGLARSIRVLLKQEEMAVAIVLQSASTLIADGVEQGRETLVTLLEAMTEAELTGDPGDPIRPRNTLVVHGTPTSAGVEQLAALPGVVEQTVEPADRAERLTALASRRRRSDTSRRSPASPTATPCGGSSSCAGARTRWRSRRPGPSPSTGRHAENAPARRSTAWGWSGSSR